MKRFSKALLLTVIALAMVLNTCGIALADGAAVTIVEKVVKADAGIKKLVFTFTEADALVNSAAGIFSFDNTVIQPVNKSGTYADVALTESATTANKKKPLKFYQNPDGDTDGNFSSYVYVKVLDNRTAVKFETYTSDPESYAADATEGMVFAEFYYRVLDAEALNSETFKLETEGELFTGLFNDLGTAYAVNLGCNGGALYKYGTPSTTDTELLGEPTLTYTGSDIPAGPVGPTTYDVTVAEYANGYVKADATLEDVEEGSTINFEFTPHMGYALTSLKINDVESFTSVVNGKYALTVAADTTVAAVFTAVAANVEGDVFTASKVYELPEDADAADAKDQGKSKLTFGKAVEVAGKTARNMGMEVQVKDGDNFVDYATPKGVGPKYRAHTPVNNQFGIRFFSFPAGTYRVRSYVDYEDLATGAIGESIYGEYVEFTVE